MSTPKNLYCVHISIHGLIRGNDLELGRDADTGGQCKYVLELVKALATRPEVEQVDLITRLVSDPRVDADYAQPFESLGAGASIKRVAAGPRRYLHKESLWRYLDAFVDQSLALFREANRLPDIIHAHYADAGYVGSRLAALLGCPFIFTGHSLGRTKRARLLEGRSDPDRIEKLYNLNARIEAEEMSLDAASMVCTSTQQEVAEQYAIYDSYAPERMKVIPPGVDVSRFMPPDPMAEAANPVASAVDRFLDNPEKPIILAIARADEKKNLRTLIHAYGSSPRLRATANLVVVAGNRQSIQGLNPGARRVWTELLQLIDDYDLYGSVAIPKHHEADDIPAYYRYAALRRGVFVNPALTEPFGLTVIEAAASGLPVVATNDGGPRDILANCKNGLLIDPTDVAHVTQSLEEVFADPSRYDQWVQQGLSGVHEHYTWSGHVDRYLKEAEGLLEEIVKPDLITSKIRTALPLVDRMVFCGLEDTLLEGDAEAIATLRRLIEANIPQLGFGIATGRSLEAAVELLERYALPQPDVFITQLGGEIYYGARRVQDESWQKLLSHHWNAELIMETLAQVPGLVLQPQPGRQHRYKISYEYDGNKAPRRRDIQKMLREKDLRVKVLLSEDRFLDVIPLRSGKGQAIRYVSMRWALPADKILFYARRGSDYEALSGQFLAVLGADHSPELKPSESLPRVYLAQQPNFQGLVEGIRAYNFDQQQQIVPDSAKGLMPEDAAEQEAVLLPDVVAHQADQHLEDKADGE